MEQTQVGIKHWRAFGTEEWGHVKGGAFGLLLGSLLPVVLFYGAFRTWGFTAAVILVLSWSSALFAWHYRRGRGADVFSATTFGFACVKALAGLASQDRLPAWVPISSVTLYLAWPSLENVVYGSAFLGSALLGRPLLALFAQRLYPIPSGVRGTTTYRRAFVVASGAWMVGHLLRAIVRLWLLATLPLELYLITDTVAGWPINLSLAAFTAWYPLRELRRAGFMSVTPRPISAADAVELAVEEGSPSTV